MTEQINGAAPQADVPQPVVPPPGAQLQDEGDELERISTDEMAYHNSVLGNARAAQAAFSSWAQHLANKYRIGDHDRINEDGTISRNVPEPAPQG